VSSHRYGYVSLEELLDWVRMHPLSSGRTVPVCIWGEGGIGKSALVEAYARENGLAYTLYHPAHDDSGSDIVGIQYIDAETGLTRHALPAWLPTEPGEGGIMFIDEINRANEQVLQGLMEVLGQGTISQSGWRIPDGWSIVAAANPPSTDYSTAQMDQAMYNRMLHYSPGWDAPAWVVWAEKNGLSRTVIDFALENPDLIRTGSSQLPQAVRQIATPRTLEFLAMMDEERLEPRLRWVLAQGLLGEEAAEVYMLKYQDPDEPLSPREIVAGRDIEERISRWRAEHRSGLIIASTGRLLAALKGRTPDEEDQREVIRAGIARWMMMLDDQLFRDAVASFAESAPLWLKDLQDHDIWGVKGRMPANPALIRRALGREMEEERKQRLQMTRDRKLAQAKEAGADVPLLADDGAEEAIGGTPAEDAEVLGSNDPLAWLD